MAIFLRMSKLVPFLPSGFLPFQTPHSRNFTRKVTAESDKAWSVKRKDKFEFCVNMNASGRANRPKQRQEQLWINRNILTWGTFFDQTGSVIGTEFKLSRSRRVGSRTSGPELGWLRLESSLILTSMLDNSA